MKYNVLISLAASLLLVASSAKLWAQVDAPVASPGRSAGGATSELDSIRREAQTFATAFNQGDSKAVAACWAEDGDYVDETGAIFRGRAAIETEYAKFFAAHPGVSIQLTIDSLRLVNDGAAIEDGRTALVPPPLGAISSSKYTAVHVKVNGQWLLSTVRDLPPPPAQGVELRNLAWMIGSWAAESRGATTEASCQWVADNRFIQRNFVAKVGGRVTISGVQIIGWNPAAGAIQSWTFSSDGGFAIGTWTPRDGRWLVESHGVLADGASSRAINLLTPLDNDAFAWQSMDRAVGDAKLADTEEIVLKRQPANHIDQASLTP